VSLDRRLRDELRIEAETITADVDRNLGAVEARSRRRSSIGASTLVVATAVVALAIGIRLGTTAPPSTGATPAPSPTAQGSPLASFDAIAGTYVVTLDAADPTVASTKIGGTWTMRLVADGEIFLSPPATFGSGTSSLSGLAFTLEADRFRSNIFYNDFCNSVGTYTWALAGGQLSFAPVDDTCPIRLALLSTTPWRVGP
jgi:hypothetical protein